MIKVLCFFFFLHKTHDDEPHNKHVSSYYSYSRIISTRIIISTTWSSFAAVSSLENQLNDLTLLRRSSARRRYYKYKNPVNSFGSVLLFKNSFTRLRFFIHNLTSSRTYSRERLICSERNEAGSRRPVAAGFGLAPRNFCVVACMLMEVGWCRYKYVYKQSARTWYKFDWKIIINFSRLRAFNHLWKTYVRQAYIPYTYLAYIYIV